MTEHQNDKQKRQRRMILTDTRTLFDVFPNVAQITINYEISHISAFGHIRINRTMIKTPSDRNDFTIDCLNRECTEGWFDLKGVIWNMIRLKQITQSGDMRCNGYEAPDHMNQSCGGTLVYKINIKYQD